MQLISPRLIWRGLIALLLLLRGAGPKAQTADPAPQPAVAEAAEAYVRRLSDQALAAYTEGLPPAGLALWAAVDTTQGSWRDASAEARGDFWHNYGALLAQQGQDTAAEAVYRQALRAYQTATAGDTALHLAQSRTWQMLSLLQAARENWPAARAAAWHNLRLRRRYAPASSWLGDAYSDLGHIYSYMDRIDSAVWAYETALTVYQPGLGPYHQSTGLVANNLGALMGQLGDYRQELVYAQQALAAWQRDTLCPPDRLALAHERLSIVHGRLGDAEKSLDHLSQARDIRVAAFGPDAPETAVVYLHLGRHQILASRAPDSCRRLLQHAYTILAEDSAHTYLRKITAQALAQHARYQGRYAEALHLFGQALTSAQGHARAGIYINMGGIYKAQGNWRAALDCLQAARQLVRGDPSFGHHATLWSGIGLMQAYLGEVDSSLTAHQQALSLASQGPAAGGSLTNPPPPTAHYLTLLERKAHSLLILYESQRPDPAWLAAASATYDQALTLVRHLQTQAQSTPQILTEESRAVFEGAMRATWLRYQAQQAPEEIATALNLMAGSQAASLRKHLQSSRAVVAAGLPDSLRQRLTRLDGEIAYLEERLHQAHLAGENPDAPSPRYWRSRRFALKETRRRLLARVSETYPRYFDLTYAPPTPGLLPRLRASLGPERQLVAFFAGDSVLYTCTLGADTAQFRALPASQWEQTLGAFRACLPPHPAADSVTPAAFAEAGEKLYAALLAPLLLGPTPPRHLHLVPDGPLTLLPFELLLWTAPPTGPLRYGDLPYLGQVTTVSYGFALDLRSLPALPKATAARRLAGFAPAYTGTARSAGRGLYDRQGPFQPLHHTQPEVDEILTHWPGRAWLGPQATEAAFRAAAPDYPLLHLAMHAVMDTTDPLYAMLVFAPPPAEAGGDSRADGLLHAYEIYNLQLPAELIVLSACNTGTGQYRPGEGPFSLARAFAFAGAQRQVVSRWPVDDAATHLLMGDFYARLAAGEAPAEALRAAQMTYRQRFPQAAPALWGGFMSFGGDPLPPQDASPLRFGWLATLSLLCLAVMAWVKRRNLRQFF